MPRRVFAPGLLVVLLGFSVLVGGLAGARAQSDVTLGPTLLADDFSDPSSDSLDGGPDEEGIGSSRIEAGEYILERVAPGGGYWYAETRAGYRDVAVAIDARLPDSTPGQYLLLACRADERLAGFELRVDPAAQRAVLRAQGDAAPPSPLALPPAAQQPATATYRLELRCVGSQITALINGAVVASERAVVVVDAPARVAVGAERDPATGVAPPMIGFFDNLLIRQAALAPTATPVAATTTPAARAGASTPAANATATPVAPVNTSGPLRLSGALAIGGSPAARGVRLTAYVGDQVCGSVQTTEAGRYALEISSATTTVGCGAPNTEVRLAVAPFYGSGWQHHERFPFRTGVEARDVNIDLWRLPPERENVPWNGTYWRGGTTIPYSICDSPNAELAAAVATAIEWWRIASAEHGLTVTLVRDDSVCGRQARGIAIIDVDLESSGIYGVALAVNDRGQTCSATRACTAHRAVVAANSTLFYRRPATEQASTIAHELGHALGLGHARRCNGGTIMWSTNACLYPETQVGVDDIASLNAKFAAPATALLGDDVAAVADAPVGAEADGAALAEGDWQRLAADLRRLAQAGFWSVDGEGEEAATAD